MKTIKAAVLSGATLLGLLCAGSIVSAQDSKPVDRVQLKDGRMLKVQGGETADLDKEVSLPNHIKVMTNGTFQVKGGKVRELKEGQSLGVDGMLTSPDGSIVPVFDHVIMKNGRPMITKDGHTTPVTGLTALGDGRQIAPDGFVVARNGARTRLLDGQLFKLDGSSVAAKDTITLSNGKVSVQKDGSLLQVPAGRSLMMNDGTKVFGDGTVLFPDGTQKKLAEGEIVAVEGVVRKN